MNTLQTVRVRKHVASGLWAGAGGWSRSLSRSRLALCVAAAVLAFQTPGAWAQADPAVGEFYARVVRGVDGVAGKTGSDAVSACVQFFRSVAAGDSFASATAEGSWKKMNASQRAAYRGMVEQRIAGDCARESGGASGGSVTLVGVSAGEGSDRLVTTYLRQPDGQGLTMVWRVRASSPGAQLRAVDLIVDGRSAVQSLRQKTNSALAQSSGNIDTMIGVMRR